MKKDKILLYWIGYYALLSILNLLIYLKPVFLTGYLSFLLIPSPFFIILLLSFLTYKFKNSLMAYLFLIIYSFIFLLHLSLVIKSPTISILNIFLLLGIVGAFQYFFIIRNMVKDTKNKKIIHID